MPTTDIREKTEVWVALRRDENDRSGETAGVVDRLELFLKDIVAAQAQLELALAQLKQLKDADTGYARYHIQGIATTQEIATSMCRDATYLIGPLPVNVALPHDRTDWPGLHFPLED